MKVLIKNATILSAESPLHHQTRDLIISDGFIRGIGENLTEEADTVIRHDNLYVSAGWMDGFANFCDPGDEYQETLETGAAAAAAGGFTAVAVMPNTRPVIDGKSGVEYVVRKSAHLPVTLYPLGAITKEAAGSQLCEMFDMHQSGAIAFTDGLNPVQQAGIFQKALEYGLMMDMVAIQVPDDRSVGASGLMNEGRVSTLSGLAGKPALAEELMVGRDIELARYTGGRVHFTGISTEKSLRLIERARQEGLKITCSVTPYHLFFTDEDVAGYDTNLKVNPPLRTARDRDALIAGVQNGLIDFIASHHEPQNYDHKVCEFEYARAGMEGLESVFSAARKAGISAQRFVDMQTARIREIFHLPIPQVDEGEAANLTLFTPDEEFTFTPAHIVSKSKNNAFTGHPLKGRPLGIIHGNQLILAPNL